MNIVKVRSPFIIEVNEIGQDGSKIELFIWNKGYFEPTVPTYSLSKLVPVPVQTNTSYNVSNFVKDYIDNIRPDYADDPYPENSNEWVLFKIKRYTLSGTVYTLLDTTSYVGVNGFTNYENGVNDIIVKNQPNPVYALGKQAIVHNRYGNTTNYMNVIAQESTGAFNLIADYYNTDTNILIHSAVILGTGTSGEISNIKVPLTYGLTKNQLLVIRYEYPQYYVYSKTIEECKYTPVLCKFINRYGGWEFLTFYKARTDTVNVSGSSFKLSQQNIDYNVYKGQSKSFNINGIQTVKLNTGFVEEVYSEIITDLMLTETILLDDKPAKIKTQSSELKKYLNEKLINYQIEFEYNFDLINNVQ